MPTRPLPSKPSLRHLKDQARDLRDALRRRAPDACQRVREFHPAFRSRSDDDIAAAPFRLTDAQLAIAREYGFASWPKLKACVEGGRAENLSKPHNERIVDAEFKHAVSLLDAGDIDGLRRLLTNHPDLVHRSVEFEGGNYFRSPRLLEFIAENPTRHGTLPPNIVEIARLILESGAKDDRDTLNATLGIVASSSVARESGVQSALIELLCANGADPNAGVPEALLYGEFAAVDVLLHRGAREDAGVAAALGHTEVLRSLVPRADDEARQRALALAAQHGRLEAVRVLLDAGADPNRYTPVGGHSHATAFHQAVVSGNQELVKLMLGRGASTDIADIRYGGTPLDWAEHLGKSEIAAYLRNWRYLSEEDR